MTDKTFFTWATCCLAVFSSFLLQSGERSQCSNCLKVSCTSAASSSAPSLLPDLTESPMSRAVRSLVRTWSRLSYSWSFSIDTDSIDDEPPKILYFFFFHELKCVRLFCRYHFCDRDILLVLGIVTAQLMHSVQVLWKSIRYCRIASNWTDSFPPAWFLMAVGFGIGVNSSLFPVSRRSIFMT